MVRAALLLALILPIAASLQAQAYDEDTHFYGTYAMARYAGIRPEVAARIALSAQWMDESFISDPTSMIVLPITGIKKRRLLHFPSARVVGSLSASTQQSFVDHNSDLVKFVAEKVIEIFDYKGPLDTLNFMTETTEDNPFASELLMQGLKEGNLMMASASLHTLEDSFAHAGTPAEQGHASFWHWPDRPFASTDKYFRMVRVAFSALVAIRAQLPPEALDCNLHLASMPSGQSNCTTDAATLAQNYSRTDAVLKAVSEDVLRNPEYVRFAMRDFLTRAAKAGYLKVAEAQVDGILAKLPLNGKLDSYDAAELVIRAMLKRQMQKHMDLIDVRFVLSDMGRIGKDAKDSEIADYIDSYGLDANALSNPDSEGIRNLVHAMAHELLKWKVPAPLNDSHRMELEDDSSPIRQKEIEIRVRNMRTMIRELFSTDIQLVGNNSKDDVGFAKEVWLDKAAEPVIPSASAQGGTYYATFNLREKNQWDRMIFKYLFPNLKDSDLTTLVNEGAQMKKLGEDLKEYLSRRKAINEDPALNFVSRKIRLIYLDFEFGPVTSGKLGTTVVSAISDIKPIAPTFLSDLANTHMTPSPDNFYYRNPRLFSNYRNSGVVKPLLTTADVWTLPGLVEEAAMQSLRKPN